MAQFSRPEADTNNPDSWTDEGGASTDLYQSIDETSPSDADYVKSVVAPSNDVVVFKMSTVEDPLSSSSHVLRFRRAKDASGGAQIDITHQLRQGYTNEGSPGTLIREVAETDVTDTFATTSTTLSGAEADAITDYSALYLRVLANQA